ncbi:MAG: response regulator transcription factor [Lachnospiraceae bacterium]
MRLLLAEDEIELSDALKAILRNNNYEVEAVYNGEDALAYLESEAYDGAILDIMMPKMDGLTVLQKIRASGNKVPILMLTAKSGIDDRVAGLDGGADDYLSKPFSAKELLARIRAITRRQTEAVSAVIKIGNIELNCASFELHSPAGSMRLSNKEFQMLEMLVANPGQVISTERFRDKLWAYDSDVENNIVWVYISFLRKKLAAAEANVQIKTNRNQGYSIEVQE